MKESGWSPARPSEGTAASWWKCGKLGPASKAVHCGKMVWRWDFEVNFRDEKTLLGVGQAQVRHESSTQAVPAPQLASYALLLLAAWRMERHSHTPPALPPPQWSASQKPLRTSTQRLLQQLRAEVWARGLGLDLFSGFSSPPPADAKPEKLFPRSLPPSATGLLELFRC